jgi:hypothetical protein
VTAGSYARRLVTAATMMTMMIVAAIAHNPSALMLIPHRCTDNLSDMGKPSPWRETHRAKRLTVSLERGKTLGVGERASTRSRRQVVFSQNTAWLPHWMGDLPNARKHPVCL